MRLRVKNDELNTLLLQEISDVDKDDNPLLGEGTYNDVAWSRVWEIIKSEWKSNEGLKERIVRMDNLDDNGNPYESSIRHDLGLNKLIIFDADDINELYSYSIYFEPLRLTSFYDLILAYPKEIAHLFKKGYLEFVDANSDDDKRIIELFEASTNEANAFWIIKHAAESGCKEAYGELGEYYLNGTGTTKNLEAAYKCFEAASKFGDVLGKLRIADMYMNGIYLKKSYLDALHIFTEASLLGSLDAVANLATLYLIPDFDRMDEEMSLIYAEAGAKHGSDVCKKIAGDYYLNKGIEKGIIEKCRDDDFQKAFEYYDSMTHSKEKCHSLGHYFEVAYGHLRINKCTGYYNAAISLGDRQAAYELARIYSENHEFKNLEQAKEFYEEYLKMEEK